MSPVFAARGVFLFLIISILLTGCISPTTNVRIVESEKMKLIELDGKYLKDCGLREPPDVMEYLSAGMDGREDMLSQAFIAQHKYLKECTIDKRSLRSIIEKQRQAIKEHNEREAERALNEKIRIELEHD